MSKNTDQALRDRIELFVDEISDLVRASALEAVREALGGEVALPARRGPGRPPKAAATRTKAKSGKRIRRTGADLEKLQSDILAHVKSQPGERLGDIAKALGVETKDARRPAFGLLDEGKLRTEGQRGGTRYFPAGRVAAARPAARPAGKPAKKTAKKAAKKTKARKKAKARK